VFFTLFAIVRINPDLTRRHNFVFSGGNSVVASRALHPVNRDPFTGTRALGHPASSENAESSSVFPRSQKRDRGHPAIMCSSESATLHRENEVPGRVAQVLLKLVGYEAGCPMSRGSGDMGDRAPFLAIFLK
jgi:hypothetical protein